MCRCVLVCADLYLQYARNMKRLEKRWGGGGAGARCRKRVVRSTPAANDDSIPLTSPNYFTYFTKLLHSQKKLKHIQIHKSIQQHTNHTEIHKQTTTKNTDAFKSIQKAHTITKKNTLNRTTTLKNTKKNCEVQWSAVKSSSTPSSTTPTSSSTQASSPSTASS